MRALFAVAILGCGPALAPVSPRELVQTALAGANSDDLETLFHRSVVNGGLWFDDPACASKFVAPGEVEAADQPAFANCLAALHLQASEREDALGDVTVLTYAPGIEVEARVVQELDGPHLVWIGYASHGPSDPLVPTITSAALESIRITGDRNGPLDPQIAATLPLDPTPTSHAQFTWIQVCLDQTGAIIKTHAGETTSHEALVAFAAATEAWRFKPFVINGQPVPVCSMERLSYPPDQGPSFETLPLPPPPPKTDKREPIVFTAGTKLIEGKRIVGNKYIRPDPQTSMAIHRTKTHSVKGSFRVCLDEAGHVESVLPAISTGFANYDRELMAGMQQWIYSPYMVDGQPVPVCTHVTFFYNQH